MATGNVEQSAALQVSRFVRATSAKASLTEILFFFFDRFDRATLVFCEGCHSFFLLEIWNAWTPVGGSP